MSDLEKLLEEIKERTEKVPPLPYKHFPVVLCGRGDGAEEYQLINDYLDFGLSARFDVPRLLAVIAKLREQRNYVLNMSPLEFDSVIASLEVERMDAELVIRHLQGRELLDTLDKYYTQPRTVPILPNP